MNELFRFALSKDGCSGCPAGHFASLGMAECQTCSPGTFTATSGEVECSVCLPGTFAPLEKSSSCLQCAEGQETLVLCCLVLCNKQNGCEGILLTGSGWPGVGSYADQMQATECRKCPRGTYAPTCSGLRLFFSVIGFRFNMTLPWNRLFVCGGHR